MPCVVENEARAFTMYYVYIIQSINFNSQTYVGFLSDLKLRIKDIIQEILHILQSINRGSLYGTVFSMKKSKLLISKNI